MEVFLKLILHVGCAEPGMSKDPKIRSLHIFAIFSEKNVGWRWFFCMQIRMKVSYKLALWFLMGIVKHSQSSQNSKFAMSLQYLKKEVGGEIGFLHAEKHQSFLQVDFDFWASKFPLRWYYHYCWPWSSILKLLKVTSLHYLYNISKKKSVMEFIFFMQIASKFLLQGRIVIFDESGQTWSNYPI